MKKFRKWYDDLHPADRFTFSLIVGKVISVILLIIALGVLYYLGVVGG